MNLAAGSYKSGVLKPSTFNMRFVLDMPSNTAATALLFDTHLQVNLCGQPRQDVGTSLSPGKSSASRSLTLARALFGL
jgi:hypothetical protein